MSISLMVWSDGRKEDIKKKKETTPKSLEWYVASYIAMYMGTLALRTTDL